MTSPVRSAAVALLLVAAAGAMAVAVPPLDYEALGARGLGDRVLYTFGPFGAPRVASRGAFLGSALGLLSAAALVLLARLRRRGVRVTGRATLAAFAVALTLVPTLRGTPYVAQLLWGTAGALFAVSALVLALERSVLTEGSSQASPLPLTLPPASALFLLALVLNGATGWLLYHGVPHVSDSAAQLFQAKIFVSGRIAAHAPALPEFFDGVSMVVADGRWFSMYPPGQSGLLAIGLLLGVPWLVTPAMGALSVFLVARAGREIFDDETGRFAGLLALVSPFLLFLSTEFMSHATATAAFAAFLLFSARSLRTGSVRDGIAAGLAAGFLVAVRPYTALGLLLPAAAAAPLLLRGRRAPGKAWGGLLLAGTACVGLLLAYNAATTGSPFVFGYAKLHGAAVAPGLGNAAWGEKLTLARALDNARTNVNALEKALFEWPVPALAFAAGLLASGRARRWDAVLALCAAGLLAAYTFYWFFQVTFGPRFLAESLPCLVLLTARALVEAKGALAPRARARLVLAMAACVLWAALVPVPYLVRVYGTRYLGGTADAVDAVRSAKVPRALVFVTSWYPAAFSRNAPGLDGPIVYARDRGEDDARLMALYPDRPAFREVAGRLLPLRR